MRGSVRQRTCVIAQERIELPDLVAQHLELHQRDAGDLAILDALEFRQHARPVFPRGLQDGRIKRAQA
jgi:hypothetical protein